MNLADAFDQIKGSFPVVAQFEGTHFKYAQRSGVTLIESKRWNEERGKPLFCYWLLSGDQHRLVHTSTVSKLRPMQTIGDSFTPRDHGDQ